MRWGANDIPLWGAHDILPIREQAHKRGLYDELVEGDLVDSLAQVGRCLFVRRDKPASAP